jgi:hypothetical protein
MKEQATTEINSYWEDLPSPLKGTLGNVISDVTICSDGKGFYREHQYGAIYWRPSIGCKSVYGAVWNLYSKLSKEKSYLGYPVTEEEWTPDQMHRYTAFENGIIAWHRILGYSFLWPAELEIPSGGALDVINIIRNMLLDFHIAQKRLGDRRKGKENFEIQDEYDMQDLLYFAIRTCFPGVELEDPVPKVAGSSSRVDLVLKGMGIIIEIKYVSEAAKVRGIVDDLKSDIESYYAHPECAYLFCFIYDPKDFIDDPKPIENDLSGPRIKRKKKFTVEAIVCPRKGR